MSPVREQPARTDRAAAWQWGLPAGAAVLATAVLVAALLLTGGGPQPAPAGLPDAGPGTGWAVPVLRLVQHLAALGTVGALLLGLLGITRGARPRLPALWVGVPAACWAVAALASVVVGLSEAAGRPLGTVLQVDLVRAYAEQVSSGRALLTTALLASAVALGAPAVRTAGGRAVLLALALAALLPPLRTGHAATSDDHTLAVTAVSVHVVAVVLWVGGLVALALGRRAELLVRALPRYSTLALLCFGAVGGSGAVAAWTRLASAEQLWTTGYGALLLTKVVLLAALAALGWQHRRRSLPAVAAGRPGSFRRLALAEVGLMAAALALGVALSRTAA